MFTVFSFQPSTLGRPKAAHCPLNPPRALSNYHLSVLAPRGDFARQGVHPTAKARQVPRKGDACRSDPLEGLNTEGFGGLPCGGGKGALVAGRTVCARSAGSKDAKGYDAPRRPAPIETHSEVAPKRE